jgi:hypothetical protein
MQAVSRAAIIRRALGLCLHERADVEAKKLVSSLTSASSGNYWLATAHDR